MAWIFLIVAGLLEVAWTVGLKYTQGWTRLWPSALTMAGMIASFFCLSQAIRTIPMGTGYAVWTGIGAVGAAIIGILFYSEPHNPGRVICLILIIVGIVGLKFASPQG